MGVGNTIGQAVGNISTAARVNILGSFGEGIMILWHCLLVKRDF